MAARRCDGCDLTYPLTFAVPAGEKSTELFHVCEELTTSQSGLVVPGDWKSRVAAKKQEFDKRAAEAEEYELRAPDFWVVSDPKILEWRQKVLTKMGFTEGQSEALAIRADVDLHVAETIVAKAKEKGTPLDVIFDLLS